MASAGPLHGSQPVVADVSAWALMAACASGTSDLAWERKYVVQNLFRTMNRRHHGQPHWCSMTGRSSVLDTILRGSGGLTYDCYADSGLY
jgi:hypothetical protein